MMQKIKKRVLWAWTLVAAFGVLMPILIAPTAHALDSSIPIADQTFSYAAYVYLTEAPNTYTCIGASGGNGGGTRFASNISPEDASAGKWFSGGNTTRSGVLLAPDGQADCNNGNGWLSKAMQQWGWGSDYGSFLCAIGYSQLVDPAKGPSAGCKSSGAGDGGFQRGDVTAAKVATAIKSKYYGGATPSLTPAMRYYLYLTSFTVGCSATPIKPWANATPNERSGDTQYRILMVNSSGAVEEMLFHGTKGHKDNVTIGEGVENGTDELSCGALEKKLQDPSYSNAYAAEFTKNKTNIPPSTGADTSGTTPDSCTVLPDTAGRWLTCMLLDWGQKAALAMDTTIQNFLYTPTEQIFTPQLKSAWNTFRIMGVVFVLMAGLVMVISQAIGLELFDAYTVKKVLPRLLIAAIGISLSWPIMQFVITFFNDLGLWAHDIILFPFKSLDNLAVGSIFAGGAFITGGIAVGMVLLGVMGLLSLLGTVILALLIGLLVLSLRQIIILMAVLMAPLAIAAYILPGTQKLWEFWKNTFLTALYMFPIIMAFIAGGKALSLVAASVQNSPQMHLLSVIVYFAPYFLLPFAFKLAGGLMATVFSISNDKSRGAFDRLKKGRQNTVAGHVAGMKAGKRWQGNRLADRASHSLQTASLLGQAGFDPRRMRGRVQSARSTRTSALSAEGAEKSTAVRSVLGNDDLLQASVHGAGTEADARSYLRNLGQEGQFLEQNVGSIRQAKRDMGKAAFEDFAAANIAGTGTGFAGGGAAEMFQTINRVAGTDRARAARILNSARGQAERAKRVDLYGAGFGTSADMLQQMYESNTEATANHVNEVMTDESLNSKSAGEIGTSRNNGLVNMSGSIVRRIARVDTEVIRSQNDLRIANAGGDATQIATATGRVEDATHEQKRILAHTASLLDVAGSSSPENAQLIGGILGQQGVGSTETVGKRIDNLRGDDEFGQYRREYGSARGEAAAGGGFRTPTQEG